MKRTFLMLMIITVLIGCKKDKAVVKEIPVYRFDLEALLSFKNNSFEDVKNKLKQYITEEFDNESFYIQAIDGDKKSRIAFARSGTRVFMIDVHYKSGNKNIAAEMKLNQESWHYYFNKIHNTYGEARTRLFAPYGGKMQIFNSNAEFISTVLKEGELDGAYLVSWKISSSELQMNYNNGAFQLIIM